jgi:hypothetical protein
MTETPERNAADHPEGGKPSRLVCAFDLHHRSPLVLTLVVLAGIGTVVLDGFADNVSIASLQLLLGVCSNRDKAVLKERCRNRPIWPHAEVPQTSYTLRRPGKGRVLRLSTPLCPSYTQMTVRPR